MSVPYYKAILKQYLQLKESSRLSALLVNPTTANIRNECARICMKGVQRKDEPVLRAYFTMSGDDVDYAHRIDHFELDKFRPIVTLLKKGYRRANHKHYELIAWLIGFEPRPYDPNFNYGAMNAETSIHPDDIKMGTSHSTEPIVKKILPEVPDVKRVKMNDPIPLIKTPLVSGYDPLPFFP